jgi:diadenosine tetraphosphate (Ap4A) HIT family hydrolase
MHCPFCKIGIHNPPGNPTSDNVFLATEHVLGFLDIQPLVSSQAHVLITPRKHYVKMENMWNDSESSAELGRWLSKITKVLAEELKADSYNIIQNNGHSAGQVVDHVHFHVVIRQGGEKIPVDEGWPEKLRQRLSYSALVFGRGVREDLDAEWTNHIVPRLRSRIKKLDQERL